jgi:CubicO group peptidase (beta-lactamase class C family)
VLDTMRTAQAPATRYGLGYEVTPPLGSYAIAGHSGSNFGWKADMLIIPAAGIGVVMLTNSDPGAVRRVVMRTVQQAVSERLMRR